MGSRVLPNKENTCCVIVTYHPGRELTTNLARLAEQVRAVVLVDNASSAETKTQLRDLATVPGVHIIQNHSNLGLATALNQGLDWAVENRFDWVLTLDQDTQPSTHIIQSYSAILASVPHPEEVAILGSNFIDPHFGSGLCPADASTGWVEAEVVITSGMLLATSAAAILGPFRDDFFIDLVDHEYCLRARSQGYKVIMSCDPLIEHAIGVPRLCRFLGRQLLTTDAPAARRFYVARNFMTLWRQYRKVDPAWIRAGLNSRVKEVLLMVMFEEGKCRKLWAVLRGVVAGTFGRTRG